MAVKQLTKKQPGKKCPVCGRKMTQQFTDLYHCNCGVSKIRQGKGWVLFRRTKDMVFCLDGEKRAIIKTRNGVDNGG